MPAAALPASLPVVQASPDAAASGVGPGMGAPSEVLPDAGDAWPGDREGSSQLRWSPPPLVDPLVITLGTGATHVSMSTRRDYIVKFPATKKAGATWLDGGHNVVVIGGAATIPEETPEGSANDWQRTGIYISNTTGTVHIEGVEIDGSGGSDFDGVAINAPAATVQLQNMRIVGVRGRYDGWHADVVQTWGGVRALRIDRLTGSSNYQGLTIPIDLGPIGSADISRVDLTDTEAPTVKGGHLVWLTTGAYSCQSYPVALSDVYVKPRADRPLDRAVWPSTASNLPCDPYVDAMGVSWPELGDVTGTVALGPPPSGSYVPAGAAGLGYVPADRD